MITIRDSPVSTGVARDSESGTPGAVHGGQYPDAICNAPWGTHCCLFYTSVTDIVNTLVPYFRAGLANNEYCLCTTSEPLGREDAIDVLRRAIPGFESYQEKEQVEINTCLDIYDDRGQIDTVKASAAIMEKYRYAVDRGFSGLRIFGTAYQLEKCCWKDLIKYENEVNRAMEHHNMKALCLYCLGNRKPYQVLDVAIAHQYALARYGSRWKMIENPEISEIRKTLQKSEASLARSQAMAHLGSFEYDARTGTVNGSRELYRIFGLEAGVPVALEALVSKISPDDVSRVTGSIKEAIYGNKPVNVDFRIIPRKDALRVIHMEGEAAAEDGRGFFGIVQDITERRRTEEELAGARTQAELYLDLMGHDINNLNQIAIGFLETALSTLRLDRGEQELLIKPLDAIKSSSKLIRNVGKMQKAKGGKAHEVRPIDLCDILARVKDRYEYVPGRDITIHFRPLSKCLIEGNDLLQDVFSNLIDNAIKHTNSEKPLIIWLGVEPAYVEDRKYYRIAVEDNGPGIPESLKRTLFVRLMKGKARTSGRGLGLFLVKTLVEDFGGDVWVEDRVPGDYTQGTRFVVLLPAID